MKKIKHLIIDMDGVLWRGETPMDGLADFFAALDELEIDFVLATNNASKTPEQYVEKLGRFGVTITPDHVFTSALATAAYMAAEHPDGGLVYVIGDKGLQQALTDKGFQLVNGPDGRNGRPPRSDFVAVGFYQEARYRHFAEAAVCINNGAAFIGTNPDITFPSEWGPLPGAGALLALLETATGVTPTVIGKPGPIIFREAMERLGGTPDDTAMVGDRLETDIRGAHAAGIGTILLLSGITRRQDLADSDRQPDHVLDDIRALTAALRQARSEEAPTP